MKIIFLLPSFSMMWSPRHWILYHYCFSYDSCDCNISVAKGKWSQRFDTRLVREMNRDMIRNIIWKEDALFVMYQIVCIAAFTDNIAIQSAQCWPVFTADYFKIWNEIPANRSEKRRNISKKKDCYECNVLKHWKCFRIKCCRRRKSIKDTNFMTCFIGKLEEDIHSLRISSSSLSRYIFPI